MKRQVQSNDSILGSSSRVSDANQLAPDDSSDVYVPATTALFYCCSRALDMVVSMVDMEAEQRTKGRWRKTSIPSVSLAQIDNRRTARGDATFDLALDLSRATELMRDRNFGWPRLGLYHDLLDQLNTMVIFDYMYTSYYLLVCFITA